MFKNKYKKIYEIVEYNNINCIDTFIRQISNKSINNIYNFMFNNIKLNPTNNHESVMIILYYIKNNN